MYVDTFGSINASLNSSYLQGMRLGGTEADHQIFKEVFFSISFQACITFITKVFF